MSDYKFEFVEHIFSSPLVMFDVPDAKKLNKLIVAEARAWRDSSDTIKVSNKGDSWHSPDGLLSRKEPGFAKFSSMVPRMAGEYAKMINPAVNLSELSFEASAWVNINRRGGFNAAHHHGTYHLSGVYYAQQPKVKSGSGGMIEFYNSRFDHHIHDVIGGRAFSDAISLRPEAGKMVIFPSTLLHYVYPNETDEERITLAWNIKFIKKTASGPAVTKQSSQNWKPKSTAKPTLNVLR